MSLSLGESSSVGSTVRTSVSRSVGAFFLCHESSNSSRDGSLDSLRRRDSARAGRRI